MATVWDTDTSQRRQAQNRASQRAFRERRQKYVCQLETRLETLESQHTELTASYNSLRTQYALANQKLGNLRRERAKLSGLKSPENHEEEKQICIPCFFISLSMMKTGR